MVTIHLPDVCERDIDLLLLEELVSSARFCSWLLTQIGLQNTASLSEARRSVKTETGESDLELTFSGDQGPIHVLVENKIDAVFQPNQPQRYLERADTYRQSGRYGQVVTALVAPEVYFGDEEDYGFDVKISYESVLKWFLADERAPRTQYKVKLLQTAIERGRSGWQLVPHPQVSRFWRSYWELATAIAPRLSMPPPKEQIPAGSHFVVFRPISLPSNVKLKHKVAYGHVDLELRGMGDRLAEVYKSYQPVLPPGAQIAKAAKSAVIRCYVDAIDMTRADFGGCETTIRKAIETAAILLDWYEKVNSPTNIDASPIGRAPSMPEGESP